MTPPPPVEADTGAGGRGGGGSFTQVAANERQVRTYLIGNLNKRSL